MSNQGSTVMIDEARAYAVLIRTATMQAPDVVGKPVRAALDAVTASLDGVLQAQAQIATAMEDPRYSHQERLRQANEISNKAFAAATSAVNGLESATNQAKNDLQKALLPGRSQGIGSDQDVNERREDLKTLILAQSSSVAVKTDFVCGLLERALQSGDKLTSYILCNRLQFVYEAASLSSTVLQQRFAQIVAANGDPGSTYSGAALLPIVSGGGPGTALGLVAIARNFLFQRQTALEGCLKQRALG